MSEGGEMDSDKALKACKVLVAMGEWWSRMDSVERLWCIFCHAKAFSSAEIVHTTNCPVGLAIAAVAESEEESSES